MTHPPHIPRRISLIDQTAAVLRERLAQGEWGAHLPGEIELAGLLQVGRNTVRAAIRLLEPEGLLKTTNGNRRQIVLSAVFLMARPVDEFPPSTGMWIEGARVRLEAQGWDFCLQVEPLACRAKPSKLLHTLTEAWPGAVWVLHRSTSQMQRWFQARQSRVVLAGSRHAGITLPQVETDLRATSLRRCRRRPQRCASGSRSGARRSMRKCPSQTPRLPRRCPETRILLLKPTHETTTGMLHELEATRPLRRRARRT